VTICGRVKVLELCAFGDLHTYLHGDDKDKDKGGRGGLGPLTEARARFFALQLRDGLSFLHARRIIHRDLKPQNLLLCAPVVGAKASSASPPAHALSLATAPFVLKIADFGFARELTESLADTVCGSPLFMAPEVLRGERYNESADLWSVGAILFDMLCGAPPFPARDPIELMRMIANTSVKLPSSAGLSNDAQNLVFRLLQKVSSERLSPEQVSRVSELIRLSANVVCALQFANHAWLRPGPNDVTYLDICNAPLLEDLPFDDANAESTPVSPRKGSTVTTTTAAMPIATAGATRSTQAHVPTTPVLGAREDVRRTSAEGRRARASTSPSGGFVLPTATTTTTRAHAPSAPTPAMSHSLSLRHAAELTAREFVADAVVIAPNEDELVASVEQCRQRIAAVAEQADKLVDAQPADAFGLYIGALSAARRTLARIDGVVATIARSPAANASLSSSSSSSGSTATSTSAATTTSTSAAASPPASAIALASSSGEPMRLRIALGALRHTVRDIAQLAASARDDAVGPLRRRTRGNTVGSTVGSPPIKCG
jgi:serine/threonine protein kinase